ncbi:hypothetical protein GQ54DRAFT_23544 [Martensiomyces pterosporus]|nr:hypothetical protein GQ54DRAFT_23544 [Martensiomyces pterosporus]
MLPKNRSRAHTSHIRGARLAWPVKPGIFLVIFLQGCWAYSSAVIHSNEAGCSMRYFGPDLTQAPCLCIQINQPSQLRYLRLYLFFCHKTIDAVGPLLHMAFYSQV